MIDNSMLSRFLGSWAILLSLALLAACAHTPKPQPDPRPVTTPVRAALDQQLEAGDLWSRIRARMGVFRQASHPRIDKQLDWLQRNPRHLRVLSRRARPFLYYIVEATEQRNLPLELALLPMIESGFRPGATSSMKAAGLWQIMPATARHLGVPLSDWYDGRRDLRSATQAALDYLEYLYDYFDGDWLLALAAYNAGEGRVRRAIEANQRLGRPTDYWSLNLPRESLLYVPKLLALCRIIAEPDEYGIKLENIEDSPYLREVAIGGRMDLSIAALMAGLSEDELHGFNAGLRPGVGVLREDYALLLPRDQAVSLQEKLAQLPRLPNTRWLGHEVTAGETLGRIAKRYGMTLKLLREINELPAGARLVPGHTLLVLTRNRNYIVRRGDTLSAIARRHGVSYRKLALWNGISTRSLLHPGQELVIQR